jgi:hypothetical protein
MAQEQVSNYRAALGPRKELEQLRTQLDFQRGTWKPHWQDLNDFFWPRRGRFLGTSQANQANRGERRDENIIDSTLTQALDTCSAGMMSMMSSPSQPWFALATQDDDLNEYQPANIWLEKVTRILRAMFFRSNIYTVLPSVYKDLALFGTSAFATLEHREKGIWHYPMPIGSYFLAQNEDGIIDTIVRDMPMTVRQVVSKFGIDRVSDEIRRMLDRGETEVYVEIRQVIQPNPGYNPHRKLDPSKKRWRSCYWEAGSKDDNGLLSESGFDEFPVMAPRWAVEGDNVYGDSPGMQVLGDCRQLQSQHLRKAEGLEAMIKPALQGPGSLRGRRTSMVPGDITFVDGLNEHARLEPIHVPNIPINELRLDIEDIRNIGRRAFKEDLFLMFAQSDRRQITAEEIRARQGERILTLSPVVERGQIELLTPELDRSFAIAVRNRMLPPAPPELQGQRLRIDFISPMAQALRSFGLAPMQQLIGSVMQLAASGIPAAIEAVDKIDLDESIDQTAQMLSVPAKVVRTDDQVAQIRANRAQEARKQQAIAAAPAVAGAAKDLSQANVTGDNVLARLSSAVGADAGAA